MRRSCCVATFCLAALSVASISPAQPTPARATPLAATPQQQQATADIHKLLRTLTSRLADSSLAHIETLADWQRRKPELRRQLFEMLGLWPLPERTDLKATIVGTVDGGQFVVERLYFQSRPGLYVTANFYRPKRVDQPLPTILYACGHANEKIDGVSYGSKARYRHHPSWFASHGYCCLILDTLQLGEIEGIHHGLRQHKWWWWSARGYTAAGVEAWNCIRALDYLETRPEVDMKRLGMTGRSGGGNYTWLTAALDDRPTCIVPVAGIATLEDHVVAGRVATHCDCMYPVNSYGWDFATLAALTAPRPLLVANSNNDANHPLPGIYRIHAQLMRIYGMHQAADRLGLQITEGPHEDTPELQRAAFRWMNRWLKETKEPVDPTVAKPLTPQQLKVFATLPTDQRNTTAHEWFVPRADVPPPETKADSERQQELLLAELQARCFRQWPAEPGPTEVKVLTRHEAAGVMLQVLEYTSEENLRLRVYVVHGTKQEKPSRLVLTAVDSAGWQQWVTGLAAGLADQLPGGSAVEPDQTAFNSVAELLSRHSLALAVVPPRGEGPNQWDPDPRADLNIRRRFLVLGRTADDGQVWDVRRAVTALQTQPNLRSAQLSLRGTGRMAGVALYAALFEPSVEQIHLHRPPTSHRDGPVFLNVLRVLDMPQALALLLPRPVMLYGADPKQWSWTTATAKLYDADTAPLQFHGPAGWEASAGLPP